MFELTGENMDANDPLERYFKTMAHLSNDNERIIIIELLKKTQLETSDFEKKLSITKSSIMRLLRDLEEDGIIEIGELDKKTAGRRKKFYRLKNIELPGLNIQDIKELLLERKLPEGIQSKEISAKIDRMKKTTVKGRGGHVKFDPTLLVSDLILSGLDVMEAIQVLIDFEAQLTNNMTAGDIYKGIVKLLEKKGPTYSERYRELVKKEIVLEPSTREVWKMENVGEMIKDQFGLQENEAKLLVSEFGRLLEFLGYYKFSYSYLIQTFRLLARKFKIDVKKPNLGNFWVPEGSELMIVGESVNKKVFSSMLRSKKLKKEEKEEIKELKELFNKYYKRILEKAQEMKMLIPSEDYVYHKKINILKEGYIPDAWNIRSFERYVGGKFHLDSHKRQYVGSEVFRMLQHLNLEKIPLSLVDELCKEMLVEKGILKFEKSKIKSTNEHFFNFKNINILPKSERSSALNFLVRKIADRENSKQIHIHGANGWLAVPNQLQHDFKWFLVNGFNFRPVVSPPGNLTELIQLILRIIDEFRSEVALSQNFDFFNILISPFFKEMEYEAIKRSIRILISELDRKTCDIGLGIELELPEFLKNHDIWTMQKSQGIYSDFESESLSIAKAILEVLTEGDPKGNSYRNPKVILKLRENFFERESILEMISLFIEEYSRKAIYRNQSPLIMANYIGDPHHPYSSCFCNGQSIPLSSWEDSFGVSNLQTISLNMPTILSHKSNGKKALKKVEEIAATIATSLTQKRDVLRNGIEKKRLRLLSMSTWGGKNYLNLKDSISTIGISRMRKALFNFQGCFLEESEDALEFGLRLVGTIQASIDSHLERMDVREPSILVSQSNLFSSIERDNYYEEWLPIQFAEANIKREERIQHILKGGKIFYVEKPDTDFQELLVRLINSSIKLFAFVPEKKAKAVSGI
ncbi:MAG: hypothetical protein HXS48_11575 [Theionarchaea archaeon]|nr:hypothetical protein [Theionarchaea archaeon]